MNIDRELYLTKLKNKKNNKMIKIITGLRRSGKSYLLDPIFKNSLLEDGVKEDHIIKVDLDSIENRELTTDGLKLYEYIMNKVKDDDIEFVETPRLNVDKLLTGNVDLKQNAIFNATKGVVLVPKPIDKEQVANKEYVDEEVKKVKQEATSILSSYIKYVEDEEED